MPNDNFFELLIRTENYHNYYVHDKINVMPTV